ncbi:MAG: hypothetical protein ACR5LB_01565 [Wolbachia sp.]
MQEPTFRVAKRNNKVKKVDNVKRANCKKTEIEVTVMRLITSDAISKIVDENHPNNIIQNQGPENLEINDEEELEKPIKTLELSGDPGSRASSPVPSEKSPPSSVSSSVSPTLNHAKKDNGPQKKETKQPKQPTKEKPKKQENENSEATKQPNNRNFRLHLQQVVLSLQ